MSISNGRTYSETVIESAVQTFESMLLDIPSYLKIGETELQSEIEERVKIGANGDKDIEHSIRNSIEHCLLDYNNLYNCFYESFVISTYSFFEKALKIIIQEYGIVVKRDKKVDKNKSISILYIEAIKNHLRISIFDSQIEQMILSINGEFRELRNSLVHEGEMTNISTILHYMDSDYLKYNEKLDEGEYILSTLSKIKTVLLVIVQEIESNRRQGN